MVVGARGGGLRDREARKREGEKIQITSIRAKRLNELLFEHRVHLSWRGQWPGTCVPVLLSPSSPSRVTCGLRLSRLLLRVKAEKKKQLKYLGDSCLSSPTPNRKHDMG